MAYDEELETRVRNILEKAGVEYELKYMFGGVAFMIRGHMSVGVVKEDLLVKVGKEAHDEVMEEPHTRPMDFTQKTMKGFIFVEPAGTRIGASLIQWVKKGVAFAASQPIKPTKPPRAKKSPVSLAGKKKASGKPSKPSLSPKKPSSSRVKP